MNNKKLYGEIFTPHNLAKNIIDLLPKHIFSNPNLKVLDIGAGKGIFSMIALEYFMDGLSTYISEPKKRKKYIINNILYMSELQQSNIKILEQEFGCNANIIKGDFLQYTNQKFDLIIGNPPYNSGGMKKVPTNTTDSKIYDGKTIWIDFIKHSLNILNENGNIAVIIPSIWLKPDKAKIYHLLTQYKIHKMVCMNASYTNKVFENNCQTPTCYFHLEKKPTDKIINLFDKDYDCFIKYNFIENEPIPVFGAKILSKIKKYKTSNNKLDIIKTNLPGKNVLFDSHFKYKNIRTTLLNKSDLTCKLIIENSNIPLKYYKEKKLVMPHKMYGFPYIDYKGEYGISNRDNYVILSDSDLKLNKLAQFFSTKTALYLFETTRYRMRYLERYIFDLIPDITLLENFPEDINDKTICDFFEIDFDIIDNFIKKPYSFIYKN